VARRLYWASLALTPLALVLHFGFGEDGVLVFVLASAALVPLAFLIGEATEQVSEHTGPGIGGFLNASFGNAPELIIALFAVRDGLPDVVLASIAGSVVSTALLVLGGAMILNRDAPIDGRSLIVQIALVVAAVTLFLIPSVPSWHGDAYRHSLYLLTLPVALVLLVVYLFVTFRNLRRHGEHGVEPSGEGWSLPRSLTALGVATVATALVSEELVGSIDSFAEALGLSQFFVAVVIVALVGNAAEHGGAVVTASHGNTGLAAEISIASSTQVAVFVAPVVALLSGLVGKGLPLAFRPVELATMALAALVVVFVAFDSRARRWEGALLLSLYAATVVVFWFAGDG
jgi:Ca2+:H+ antiporter